MIGIVAFCTVVAIFVLVFLCTDTTRPISRDIFYNVLKFIGIFAAFLAPFSFMMVLLLPPKLNWIGYSVMCFMFGLLVTCFYLGDQRRDKISPTFDTTLTFLIPLLLSLAAFSPKSISPKLYPLIPLALSMETAYHFISCFMFIYVQTRKPSDDTNQEEMNHIYHYRCNYLLV